MDQKGETKRSKRSIRLAALGLCEVQKWAALGLREVHLRRPSGNDNGTLLSLPIQSSPFPSLREAKPKFPAGRPPFFARPGRHLKTSRSTRSASARAPANRIWCVESCGVSRPSRFFGTTCREKSTQRPKAPFGEEK